MSAPSSHPLITLELVGNIEPEGTERLLAQALRSLRVPASYGISPLPAGVAVASAPSGRLRQLLDAIDVVAEIVAGMDARGKMVLHLPTGASSDRITACSAQMSSTAP